MNTVYEIRPQIRHPRRSLLRRALSSLLTITGGLTLTLAGAGLLSDAASSWSPTASARVCFHFPEETALPDSAEVGQLMLSAAFFGNDALYFDLGEENTGISHQLTPSEGSGGQAPQQSLGETEIPDSPDRIPEGADIYSYDYSQLPKGELPLIPYDLSRNAQPGEILLSNTTAYDIDPEDYLKLPFPIQSTLCEDEPLVLIIHTHGTEAFAPEGAVSVKQGSAQRSSDITENIVAVGSAMSELLNEAGIPTIHCEIMHDLESYLNSYNLAADTIQKYLAAYPSIKYVFDVHRDAIARTDGSLVKPICALDGRVSAQIMLLVGTNEKGADHPDWAQNMTVAADLQNRLTRSSPGLARPINIRGASFNEQFTPGSLLIEIGSAANTLSEARYAAERLTYSIIDMIKENSQ